MNRITDEFQIIHSFCDLETSYELSKCNQYARSAYKLMKKCDFMTVLKTILCNDLQGICNLLRTKVIEHNFKDNLILKHIVKDVDPCDLDMMLEELSCYGVNVRLHDDLLIKKTFLSRRYATGFVLLNHIDKYDNIDLYNYAVRSGSETFINYVGKSIAKKNPELEKKMVKMNLSDLHKANSTGIILLEKADKVIFNEDNSHRLKIKNIQDYSIEIDKWVFGLSYTNILFDYIREIYDYNCKKGFEFTSDVHFIVKKVKQNNMSSTRLNELISKYKNNHLEITFKAITFDNYSDILISRIEFL